MLFLKLPHGTAPRFANTNTMNPSSVILSGVMLLLEYLGWTEAAAAIVKALGETIIAKTVTVDFYNLMDDATLVKKVNLPIELSKKYKNFIF
jgi:isocitrate dehydrogenase